MNAINIIKDYLEGNFSAEKFQAELYKNKEMESILSENMQIPPYTNSGSMYLYLIESDLTSSSGELNSKDLLSQFLTKKNIGFVLDSSHEKNYDILMKIQPSWLELPDSYLHFLMKNYADKKGRELESALKLDINTSFRFLKKKPKWLQSPQWPIENNKPLFFIGQIDISEIRHDTSYAYIFFDEEKKSYVTIEQSM